MIANQLHPGKAGLVEAQEMEQPNGCMSMHAELCASICSHGDILQCLIASQQMLTLILPPPTGWHVDFCNL